MVGDLIRDKMPPKLTQEEFIRRSTGKHGNKYGYDRVNYQGVKVKVDIYCRRCETYFEQRPDGHMAGTGCEKCNKRNAIRKPRKTNNEFIVEAVAKHSDELYRYDRVEYVGAKNKVEIYCFKCDSYFLQTASNHLQGEGCPTCAIKKTNLKNTCNIDKFIEKAIKRHGDMRYDYSKVVYVKSYKKIAIHCNLCNTDFEQMPYNHLTGNGCPCCQSSKGEVFLQNFLNTYDIQYEIQKCFPDCKASRNVLPFDIWCPDHNILIEHQGQQHTVSSPRFGGDSGLAKRQKYDEIKKRYAESTGKSLIYTHYYEKESDKSSKLMKVFGIKYELPFKNTFLFKSKKTDQDKKIINNQRRGTKVECQHCHKSMRRDSLNKHIKLNRCRVLNGKKKEKKVILTVECSKCGSKLREDGLPRHQRSKKCQNSKSKL